MSTLKVPYFKWRKGRPRWEPGPGLRARGWKGRDLKDGRGGWLPRGAAIEAAEAINGEVTQWRAGHGRIAESAPAPRSASRTFDALVRVYKASPDFKALAANSRRTYNSDLALLSRWCGNEQVASLTRLLIKEYHSELRQARGPHRALSAIRTLRLVLSYAQLDLEWIARNPANRLKISRPPPRCVLWLQDEIAALIAIADRGVPLDDGSLHPMPGIADAIILDLYTGLNPCDLLPLRHASVVDGRLTLHRRKTGVPLAIPSTPQLAARLAAIEARKKERGIITPEIIVTDPGPASVRNRHPGGRAYNPNGEMFRRQFAKLRAAAAAEMPSIAGKTFADFRDTAITRLAEAGCTIPQICAITQHSLASAHEVLKHYLMLTGRMADSAIAKLVDHLDEQGAQW